MGCQGAQGVVGTVQGGREETRGSDPILFLEGVSLLKNWQQMSHHFKNEEEMLNCSTRCRKCTCLVRIRTHLRCGLSLDQSNMDLSDLVTETHTGTGCFADQRQNPSNPPGSSLSSQYRCSRRQSRAGRTSWHTEARFSVASVHQENSMKVCTVRLSLRIF